MKRKLTVVTTSSTGTFAECPQKYYLRYELGFLPQGDEAQVLWMGSIWGKMMDAYWLAETEPFDAGLNVLHELVDPSEKGYDFVRLHAMLLGYHARWQSERPEVIGSETEFRVPIRNPETKRTTPRFMLAGATDKRVREENRVVVYDHKTSSEDLGGNSVFWKRLILNPQASNYSLAQTELGEEIVDMVWDVTGKPKLKPHKATPIESRKYTKQGALYANQRADDETPEEFFERIVQEIAESPERYYQRGQVPRTEEMLRNAARDLWGITQQIGEAQKSGFWPRRSSSCFNWNRTCAYFGVCTGTARLEDTSLFRQVDHVHVELSPEICRVDDSEDIVSNAAQSGQKEAS